VPLASLDGSTLFGGDERGYIDYPSWSQTADADAPLSVASQA